MRRQLSGDSSRSGGRPRGRPRSVRLHEAIVHATMDLLAEVGLSGLTIEGVAARADVSRPTVYRWWRSKAELAAEAVGTIADHLPVPDTGSTRKDLIALLEGIAEALSGSRAGSIERNLLPEIPRNPELFRALHATLRSRRASITHVLARGIERGELRRDLDPELAFDMLVAPVHFRFLFPAGRLDRAFLEAVVDLALQGLQPQRGRRRG